MNTEVREAIATLKKFHKDAEKMFARFDSFTPSYPNERKREWELFTIDIRDYMLDYTFSDAWEVLEDKAPERLSQMEKDLDNLWVRTNNLLPDLEQKYKTQTRELAFMLTQGIQAFA